MENWMGKTLETVLASEGQIRCVRSGKHSQIGEWLVVETSKEVYLATPAGVVAAPVDDVDTSGLWEDLAAGRGMDPTGLCYQFWYLQAWEENPVGRQPQVFQPVVLP